LPATEIDRPPAWETQEAADDLAGSIESASPDRLLLVDSLALWVATTVGGGEPIHAAWPPVERAIRTRSSGVVLVSDEVGLSPVALTEMGRNFVDALGWTNQRAAALADEVQLIVAGLSLMLKP
jgi:adenosyl cobinamide kinase/adenosyl cobinamide phosphate guanylyltransferase